MADTETTPSSIRDFIVAVTNSSVDTNSNPARIVSNDLDEFMRSRGQDKCGTKTYQSIVESTTDALTGGFSAVYLPDELGLGQSSIQLTGHKHILKPQNSICTNALVRKDHVTLISQAILQSLHTKRADASEDGSSQQLTASPITEDDAKELMKSLIVTGIKYPDHREDLQRSARSIKRAHESQVASGNTSFSLDGSVVPNLRRPPNIDHFFSKPARKILKGTMEGLKSSALSENAEETVKPFPFSRMSQSDRATVEKGIKKFQRTMDQRTILANPAATLVNVQMLQRARAAASNAPAADPMTTRFHATYDFNPGFHDFDLNCSLISGARGRSIRPDDERCDMMSQAFIDEYNKYKIDPSHSPDWALSSEEASRRMRPSEYLTVNDERVHAFSDEFSRRKQNPELEGRDLKATEYQACMADDLRSDVLRVLDGKGDEVLAEKRAAGDNSQTWSDSFRDVDPWQFAATLLRNNDPEAFTNLSADELMEHMPPRALEVRLSQLEEAGQ